MWTGNHRTRDRCPCRGLIWTMWDVNISIICSVSRTYKGLIWTMWDVNAAVLKGEYDRCQGLIWTMWDVNDYPQGIELAENTVWSELCGMWTDERWFYTWTLKGFDLNYVGCEPIPTAHENVVREGLIWTMWDVNVAGSEYIILGYISLIWTMWDVNREITEEDAKYILVWSELCGMWTHMGDIRSVLGSHGLIWTMWDVNSSSLTLTLTGSTVWSELCGMWT